MSDVTNPEPQPDPAEDPSVEGGQKAHEPKPDGASDEQQGEGEPA